MARSAPLAPYRLAHRYDEARDAVHLLAADRAALAAATFLTDEEIGPGRPRTILPRRDALAGAAPPAPLHFVFHSAYCCSTLVARLFDRPGLVTVLKEPTLLQDMVGWRRRGAPPAQHRPVLHDMLTLLAQPLGPGETVVVKPSNVVNCLADALLTLWPQAHALLLHTSLPDYLASIAKKGMWGRLWVRELLIGLLKDGVPQFGFEPEQIMGQTDLQVAALGWLMQQRLFASLAAKHGPARVRSLDSDTLLRRPADAVAALAALFGLVLETDEAARIAAGPVFRHHAKHGSDYDAETRSRETTEAHAVHGDEIVKVAQWAEAVARSAAVPSALPHPLLDPRTSKGERTSRPAPPSFTRAEA